MILDFPGDVAMKLLELKERMGEIKRYVLLLHYVLFVVALFTFIVAMITAVLLPIKILWG